MPTFTPDGKTILFVSNRCQPREESIAMDLFSVPSDGGELTRLTKDCWLAYYPASFQPLVTPDGSSVVFGALSPSLSGGMPLTHLFLADLREKEENSLKTVSLWPKQAPCHEATCFLYNCENMGGRRDGAAISSDGRYLYFVSGWMGAANLYRASLSSPCIEAVTEDRAAWRSIRRSGTTYLLTKGDFTSTPQLYLATESMMNGEVPFAPTKLTDTNPWMKELLVSPSELTVDTLDGESRIHGFVFPPKDAKPGEKYPAVVYIHGGPTPFMGCALTYEHQCITGAGMGLIIMNFRGSSGYGEAHQSMTRAYDGSAMSDILLFTREAARTFDWIDPDRLGVTGGSFGGYMTNWILGHSKVFKAGVTQRSIANELIQYASSDMAGSSKDYADFSDFMMEKLKASPVSYAEHIDVPFLILHGMQDMRCPVEHAHQLFTAVKETHPENPVRMILFPGMTHSFPMSGPMDLRIAHYDAMIDWFRNYL
jgi:dipeptidyl aminopeptidase/acylaminoacyl peptidase